jgi:hypothetical protein
MMAVWNKHWSIRLYVTDSAHIKYEACLGVKVRSMGKIKIWSLKAKWMKNPILFINMEIRTLTPSPPYPPPFDGHWGSDSCMAAHWISCIDPICRFLVIYVNFIHNCIDSSVIEEVARRALGYIGAPAGSVRFLLKKESSKMFWESFLARTNKEI